ncbi:30S ribosomal protein S20 [Wolbachia endosymbiont of Howardula sp.]|uniref:30S ribosomal protein S20 n=1 Tax=Wolbachia endosymbiont of Howardula sp. TaxID=2916816 RepID=UPI00217EFCBA|nr:30S ribosomal protein S20 [Wolbachia endosymbiont of Howardula sp.]UWI83273.1 30S ribosomal protein S20 [Wolbachia endosymbiont of Howardula sp.]
MANHKSARNMIKVSAKRTLINKMRKSQTRTAIRKVYDTFTNSNRENMIVAFKKAESILHKCVNKGIIHRNTAARKISRLNAKIKTYMIGKD